MDAKVYVMIEDLSRGACLDLLGYPIENETTQNYLQSVVRQQYETGQISGDEIMFAWEDDAVEC